MSDSDLARRVDAFFNGFRSTLELAQDLRRRRSHGLDIITLLCARLDALATAEYGTDKSHHQAFISFLTTFGAERGSYTKVSVGNVYWHLLGQHWLCEGLITLPGRVEQFSEEDLPFLTLVDGIESLPLTVDDVRLFIQRIADVLRSRYRVIAHQRQNKPYLDSVSKISERIVDRFARCRTNRVVAYLEKQIPRWLNEFTLASLLYKEYRNASVHEFMVTVGWDGFYTESSLYWSNRGDKYVGYALNVDIPAAFLCRTLESAIEQYSTYLKAKGKLPHAIHQAVFGDESLTHLDTLDYASVPATSSVRLKLRTR